MLRMLSYVALLGCYQSSSVPSADAGADTGTRDVGVSDTFFDRHLDSADTDPDLVVADEFPEFEIDTRLPRAPCDQNSRLASTGDRFELVFAGGDESIERCHTSSDVVHQELRVEADEVVGGLFMPIARIETPMEPRSLFVQRSSSGLVVCAGESCVERNEAGEWVEWNQPHPCATVSIGHLDTNPPRVFWRQAPEDWLAQCEAPFGSFSISPSSEGPLGQGDLDVAPRFAGTVEGRHFALFSADEGTSLVEYDNRAQEIRRLAFDGELYAITSWPGDDAEWVLFEQRPSELIESDEQTVLRLLGESFAEVRQIRVETRTIDTGGCSWIGKAVSSGDRVLFLTYCPDYTDIRAVVFNTDGSLDAVLRFSGGFYPAFDVAATEDHLAVYFGDASLPWIVVHPSR